jgi:hypothetical protein
MRVRGGVKGPNSRHLGSPFATHRGGFCSSKACVEAWTCTLCCLRLGTVGFVPRGLPFRLLGSPLFVPAHSKQPVGGLAFCGPDLEDTIARIFGRGRRVWCCVPLFPPMDGRRRERASRGLSAIEPGHVFGMTPNPFLPFPPRR